MKEGLTGFGGYDAYECEFYVRIEIKEVFVSFI